MGFLQRIFSPAPPAPRNIPPPEESGSLVTKLSNGRPVIDMNALAESALANGRMWDVFLRGNPAAVRQDIQPVSSTSGALGYWSLASPRIYDLEDEMREKCPPIDGTLELIVATIAGREFRVEAARDSGDAGAKIAAEVQRMILEPAPIEGHESLGDFGFDHLLTTAIIGALSHGFSVNETMWNTAAPNGMIEPSHYLHAHPGQFVFDGAGNIKLYRNDAPLDPPPGKMTLTRLPALYSNPYGRSAIFGLRYHYHFWKETLKAWAETVSLYGTPLIVGTVDADAGETDRSREASNLQSMIAGLRRDIGMTLTQWQKIEVHDRMGGKSESPHRPLVDYFERAMVRRLLGAVDQIMGAEYGNRATSEVHAGVSSIRLKPLAMLIARSFTRGIIAPIVRMNWGPNAPIPQAVIDTDDAVDVEQILKVIDVAKKVGRPVSWDQLQGWTGLVNPIDDADAVNPAAVDKQIYQYHIIAGVVTINDVRQSLGLPPEPGGDVVVDPARFALGEPGQPTTLSRAKAEEIVTLAAGSSAARKRSKALAKFMDDVAAEASKADKMAARKAIERGLAKLAKDFPGDGPITEAARLAAVGAADFTALGSGLELAMGAAKAKAMIEVMGAVGKVVDAVNPADTAKAYAPFKKSVEWMLDRKLMTASQADELARAVVTLSPKLKIKDVAASIRNESLALKDTIPIEVAAKFQRNLAAAVNNGTSINDFIDASRGAMGIAPDATVGGVDAYLENVYRTEVSSAYSRQQEENLSAPEIQDHHWGDEVHNPDDARSRPSHGALDGMLVRRGSEAYKALGPSPFSYMCRCVRSPIIEVNPAKSKLQESPDAMARIAKIERF